MTTYNLCMKLAKVLSINIRRALRYEGVLNTEQGHHRDVSVDVQALHTSLKDHIDKVRAEAEKTVAMLQRGIDVIESLPRKKIVF